VALTAFTVVTDNRGVSKLLTKESGVDHDDLLAKIVTYLQGYDVNLRHRADKKHGSADGLSRNPLPHAVEARHPTALGNVQTRRGGLEETESRRDLILDDNDESEEEEAAADQAERERFNEQLQKEDERAATLQPTIKEFETFR
jgi:hypothetical protein